MAGKHGLQSILGKRLKVSAQPSQSLTTGGASGKESACQCRRPEMRVRSLGWEDPLEKSMATHSSILAWRIPMDRGAWWAAVHGATKSWTRLSDSARCYRYCDKLIRGERKRWGICASPWKPLFRVEAGPVSDMGCPVHNVIQWITNSRNISKQEVN